jgi:hypothetical protein
MQRLVIALTAFLVMVGAVVVAGYVFVFAGANDRAAHAVPADATAYATLYLEPSAGQKMNLAALLGNVPGFADASSLDQKIHEIAARFLGEADIDYEADVRPWLGDQLSVGITVDSGEPTGGSVVVVVAVRDPEAAAASVPAVVGDPDDQPAVEGYQGVELNVGADMSWALLDDLLLVASDRTALVAAIDAEAGRDPSLADDADYGAAMRRVPADHLAAFYVDLGALAASAEMGDQLGGYSTVSLALVAERNGLRLAGVAPFDAGAAASPGRGAFALSSEPSSLSEWMPDSTQAELVIFGLSQVLLATEDQLGAVPGTDEVTDAIAQLRAVAALGLGISVDDDLLPLFDREVAVAVSGLESATPSVQLLMRPSNSDEAAAALERISDALADRGASVREDEVEGATIITMSVPELGDLSYTVREGVVIAGLTGADVVAAIDARDSGTSLADSARYRAAWELAGDRAGNELYLDVASLSELAGEQLGLDGDARDILNTIGALALTAPARDDQSEFHLVLTIR